jgi:nitrite reductase (NADH) small subunit/3-phenylpropionate/trans-cinnamate dioxygenase ferredoxin subunit
MGGMKEPLMSDQFVTVARVGEIPEGRGKTLTVGDRQIAVFCVDGEYYALDDYCPHMGASLGTSDVYGGMVVCQEHMWAFRLADGSCADVPTLRAETFEVRVAGDAIQVRLGRAT